MTNRLLPALCAALLLGLCLSPDMATAQGTTTQRTCGQSIPSTPSAGTTALVGPGTFTSPITAAQNLRDAANTIYVCGYVLSIAAASTAQFEYGTQTSTPCDTGTTPLSPIWPASTLLQDTSPVFRGMEVPAGSTLCILTTGTVLLQLFYSNIVP
jgi:hypothetical protein